MAGKELVLRLIFKGKNLDIAKQSRDFHKGKFSIGSNKDLFWQILDPSFPDTYHLIEEKDGKFILKLRKGMDLKVMKGDQVIDENTLKQSKLLKSNELVLTEDAKVSVYFSQNWEIACEFQTPYVAVLTEEQKQIIRQYSRKAELTTEQKFSRNFFIAGILFTIISMIIFDKLYHPVTSTLENTLQQRLEAVKQKAQLVTPEVPKQKKNEFAEQTGNEPAKKAEEKPEAKNVPTGPVSKDANARGGSSAGAIESQFGFDPNATQAPKGVRSARVIAVTSERDLVAEGTGGGGGGTGTSGGNRGRGAGVGAGSNRGATAFNVAPTSKRTANMGDLFEGNINVASGRGYKEVDAAQLGGKTGKIEAQRIVSSAQIGAVRSRFVSAGVKSVREAEIATSSPEVKAELGNVRNYVAMYKSQIQNLFVQESQIRDMYGALEFTIYINEGGSIAAVDIKSKSGSSFTDSFLQKAKAIIEKWKIPVNKPVIYSFSWQFIKN